MPRLELFRFRFRDPVTRKWIRARYRAERQEIAARYVEWEITGPAEIRDVNPEARAFSPHASFKVMMNAELRRHSERPPELQPEVDAGYREILISPMMSPGVMDMVFGAIGDTATRSLANSAS